MSAKKDQAEGRTEDLVETEVKEWPESVDFQQGIDFSLETAPVEEPEAKGKGKKT